MDRVKDLIGRGINATESACEALGWLPPQKVVMICVVVFAITLVVGLVGGFFIGRSSGRKSD